jgi:hypothetical protein
VIANVGAIERSIRILIGVLLLSVIFVAGGSWRWVGVIGLLPLATGLIGWCPLYAWLAQD